jgi:heme ABC exporter ATP-binding subunit CcmA
MSAAVTLRGVVALAGQFPVLAGVDLDVARGDIVCLAGPNGAGKTSLLRLCAGLIGPERGEARVLGLDLVTGRDEVRRRVGFLGHANGLYLDLTVMQNLRLWADLIGASADEVDAAAASMGLDGRLAGVRVARLSAGQKRRCAFAVLRVRRAELWLLDEPHAGLDAAGRDEVDQTLRAAAGAGATVIFASHELDRARSVATRVVRIDGGVVIEGEVGR